MQYLPAGIWYPLQARRGLQFAAPAERMPVEVQGRGRIAFLRFDAGRAEPVWLRQVSGTSPEAERRAAGRPGQRNAATVTALVRPARPPEHGILETFPGKIPD